MVFGIFNLTSNRITGMGSNMSPPAPRPIIESLFISRHCLQCTSVYIYLFAFPQLSFILERVQKSLARRMKLLHPLSLLLLTTAFYFFSHNISSASSSPSMFFLTGRRSMREQRMSSVTHRDEHENTKVLDGKTEQTTIKEDSMELEYSNSNDNLDDLVYHVDYHGVTTHPTPKHPRP